uniref:Juvenile hormone epoxide hydrolase n=1 Tax=Plutella xylostella TaxID=51655 RepID=J9TKL6_PLUXY|nr:juvenile hormone epoxide hydrolase [Plutella xylostella]
MAYFLTWCSCYFIVFTSFSVSGGLLGDVLDTATKPVSSASDTATASQTLSKLGTYIPAYLEVAQKIASSFVPEPQSIPPINQSLQWGPGSKDRDSIRPFHVRFSDEMVKDLLYRINHRRKIRPSLQGSGNHYGPNSALVKQVLDHWSQKYDFKERAKKLNRHPQYITNVNGLDIHYIHVQPSGNKRVVPILLIHSVESNSLQFSNLIDHMIESGGDFEFEIIAADMPGFGYSQATNKQGLYEYHIAVILNNLMQRLGHSQYFVHAEGCGTFVACAMGVLYPDTIQGFHSGFPVSILPKTLIKYGLGAIFPSAFGISEKDEKKMYPLLKKTVLFLLKNLSYLIEYATRPDQVGIGLDESPTALAAWFIQVYTFGANGRGQNLNPPDGNIFKNYDIDDILDYLTVVWDQQSATTSARFIKELVDFKDEVNFDMYLSPDYVPFVANKRNDDILFESNDLIKDKFPNLVQSNTIDGGHFADITNPEGVADSIRSGVVAMENYEGRSNNKLTHKKKRHHHHNSGNENSSGYNPNENRSILPANENNSGLLGK